MGEFSITHLLLIAAVFLLFFGPSRLPQLGQSLGKAIRGFKQGINEIDIEAKDVPPTKDTAKVTAEQLAHNNQANGQAQSQAAAQTVAQAEKKDSN
jgi:TatA/E family protein of Tat protein translocase